MRVIFWIMFTLVSLWVVFIFGLVITVGVSAVSDPNGAVETLGHLVGTFLKAVETTSGN